MKTTLLEVGHYNKRKECIHEYFYGRSVDKINKLLYEEHLLYNLKKSEDYYIFLKNQKFSQLNTEKKNVGIK